MKDLFQRELAIFNMLLSIRLKDVSISSLVLALIITIVNVINDNIKFIPFIGSIMTLGIVLLVLSVLIIGTRNKVEQRELQSFTCIQGIVIFLDLLVIVFFPLSLTWLKVFLAMYLIINLIIFFTSRITKDN